MTNPGPSRGWKDKRDKAAAKDFNAPDDDRAAIRAARQALYDQQAAEAAAAAIEAAELQQRARCSCPVCDGAPVEIETAERVIRALARLPAHIPVDEAVMNALRAVTYGRDISRGSIYSEAHTGLHVPHRIYAAAVDSEAAVPVPVTVTPKPTPVIPTKPKRKATAAELFAAQGDEGAVDLSD